MSCNQNSLDEDLSSVGDSPESSSSKSIHDVSSEVLSCGSKHASPLKELTSRMENLSFSQCQLPFMLQPRIVPASDAKIIGKAFSDSESPQKQNCAKNNFENKFPSRRRNVTIGSVNEFWSWKTSESNMSGKEFYNSGCQHGSKDFTNELSSRRRNVSIGTIDELISSLASNNKTSGKALYDRESPHIPKYARNDFANRLSSRRRNESTGTIKEFLASEKDENSPHETRDSKEELQTPNGSLSRQDDEADFESGLSTVEMVLTELFTTRTNDENVSPSGRDDNICSIQMSLSKLHKDVPMSEDLIEKHMIDIGNKLLEDSAEIDLDENYPSLTDYLSRKGISEEYWELYIGRPPKNYDFAMNIMAYVEFLNDDSWIETLSYFDESIKKMMKKIWDLNMVSFDDKVDIKTFNHNMILRLMNIITQSAIKEDFKLSRFLNYCVLMCQIAVKARKNGFTDAPLCAIRHLRDRIKYLKYENFVQFMFEIAVKDYAQRYVEHAME